MITGPNSPPQQPQTRDGYLGYTGDLAQHHMSWHRGGLYTALLAGDSKPKPVSLSRVVSPAEHLQVIFLTSIWDEEQFFHPS